jgi:membrane carboxypeptidase/penicillin-binding protein
MLAGQDGWKSGIIVYFISKNGAVFKLSQIPSHIHTAFLQAANRDFFEK